MARVRRRRGSAGGQCGGARRPAVSLALAAQAHRRLAARSPPASTRSDGSGRDAGAFAPEEEEDVESVQSAESVGSAESDRAPNAVSPRGESAAAAGRVVELEAARQQVVALEEREAEQAQQHESQRAELAAARAELQRQAAAAGEEASALRRQLAVAQEEHVQGQAAAIAARRELDSEREVIAALRSEFAEARRADGAVIAEQAERLTLASQIMSRREAAGGEEIAALRSQLAAAEDARAKEQEKAEALRRELEGERAAAEAAEAAAEAQRDTDAAITADHAEQLGAWQAEAERQERLVRIGEAALAQCQTQLEGVEAAEADRRRAEETAAATGKAEDAQLRALQEAFSARLDAAIGELASVEGQCEEDNRRHASELAACESLLLAARRDSARLQGQLTAAQAETEALTEQLRAARIETDETRRQGQEASTLAAESAREAHEALEALEAEKAAALAEAQAVAAAIREQVGAARAERDGARAETAAVQQLAAREIERSLEQMRAWSAQQLEQHGEPRAALRWAGIRVALQRLGDGPGTDHASDQPASDGPNTTPERSEVFSPALTGQPSKASE